MSWLRLKLAAWLSVGNIRLIANQQKQINSLEDSVGRQIGQILEILKDRTATDPNPRKDIADFQQRLDALCRVCGVEVVITDGEVYTAEVSPRAVLRSEEAAALWMLSKELESAMKLVARATDRLAAQMRRG